MKVKPRQLCYCLGVQAGIRKDVRIHLTYSYLLEKC